MRHGLRYERTPFNHGYLKTLASIWSLHTFREGPKSIFFILAFLGPDNIREDILTTEPALARIPGFPTDSIELKQILTPLRRTSIVVHRFEGILSIHRFVQDIIKAEMTEQRSFAAIILLATARLVTSVWPYTRNEGGAYPKYQQNEGWSHCESLYFHVHQVCQVFKVLPEEGQVRVHLKFSST